MEYEDSNQLSSQSTIMPVADEGSEDTEVLQKVDEFVEVDDPTEELAPIPSGNVAPTSQEENSPTLNVKAEESILFETLLNLRCKNKKKLLFIMKWPEKTLGFQPWDESVPTF